MPRALLLLTIATLLGGCSPASAPPGSAPAPELELELIVGTNAPLEDGASVPAGSELRFTLRAQARSFVVIAAALEGGDVLRLVPAAGDPLELPAGVIVRPEESVTLPPRPGPVRFLAVACDVRPPLEPLWATIAERLRDVGGDPAKLPPLGLESCRDAQRLVRFVSTPR